MASSPWTWDASRKLWYRYDPVENCVVFQDGSKVPVPSNSSPQSTRSNRTASTASASSGDGRDVPGYEQLRRQFQGLNVNAGSSATPHGAQPTRTTYGTGTADHDSIVIRNEYHNITQDPTGRETSLDQQLFRQGVKALIRVGQPRDKYETLDPKYKRRPRTFYGRGKVFRILWPEPAGSTDQGSVYSSGAFKEPYHMKIRWFVVIREGSDFCSCLPIATYNSQGVGKRTAVKDEHSVIYTGDREPPILTTVLPGYGEKEMRPSLRVRPRSRGEKLDGMSRLNYAKVYTVEHNVKVYEFGDVHKDSLKQLVKNFKAVWKMDTASGDSASVAQNIIWEGAEGEDEDEDDEDDDEDDDDDDDDDEEQTTEMTPEQISVHNYYVNHYVQAYRNNNLGGHADWLQNASTAEQKQHIEEAQEQTRKTQIQLQGKGKKRR